MTEEQVASTVNEAALWWLVVSTARNMSVERQQRFRRVYRMLHAPVAEGSRRGEGDDEESGDCR